MYTGAFTEFKNYAPNQPPWQGTYPLEGIGFSQDCWVRVGRERPKSIVIKNSELIEIVTPNLTLSSPDLPMRWMSSRRSPSDYF